MLVLVVTSSCPNQKLAVVFKHPNDLPNLHLARIDAPPFEVNPRASRGVCIKPLLITHPLRTTSLAVKVQSVFINILLEFCTDSCVMMGDVGTRYNEHA
jgi:hypothetical protein